MTQPVLFALIYAAGLAFNLAWGPRRDALLSCALAFPCGLTIWVLGGVVGLASGAGHAPIFGAGALIAAVIGSVATGLSRRSAPPSWRVLAAGTGLFAAAAVLVSGFSLAKFSPDSHQFIRLATLFARGSGVDEVIPFLADRGIFTILSCAGSELAGVEFLYSLAPVVGLSMGALLAATTWRALAGQGVDGLHRALATAGVTLAVMSAFIVAYHTVYIHANFGSGLYLFGFGALYWMAERDDDTSLLAPAFLCLTAFSLHRVEAPLFAALFAVLAVWPSRLPRGPLAGGLLLFGAVTAGWLLPISGAIPPESHFLTPGRAVMLSLLSLVPAAGLLLTRRLPRRLFDRHLPHLLLIGSAAGLVLFFALEPEHMEESVMAVAVNLLNPSLGIWGYVWWAAIVLAVLSWATPTLPVGRPMLVGIAVSVIVVLVLGAFRIPYRIGIGDSASRMAMHFAPLLFFLYAMRFVPPSAASPADERPTT